MKHFISLLATGFGVGYSPVAPGTLGTLIAIPVYYFLSEIPSPLYEITLIGFFFLSVWVSENAERLFGKKDDQRIVIDEIIGFLITMLWVPKTIRFLSHFLSGTWRKDSREDLGSFWMTWQQESMPISFFSLST
jgi:phosphatidylglycerophosphatase A